MTEADLPRAGKPAVSALAVLSALVIGAIIGGMAVEYWFVKHAVATPAAQTAAPAAGLAADVDSTEEDRSSPVPHDA